MTENIKKILLVEDDNQTGKEIADFLTENGFETEIVCSGEEAIERIKNSSNFYLILMNIDLKGDMDGIDATQKILELKEMPIVLIIADSSSDTAKRIEQSILYGILQKGANHFVILSTIKLAIRLYQGNCRVKTGEAMLSSIINETRNAVILFDEHRKVILCNPTGEYFLASSSSDIIGKKFNQLIDSYECVDNNYQKAFNCLQYAQEKNVPSKILEYKIKFHDGRERYFEISVSPYLLNGKWLGLIIADDISLRKQEQEELKLSRNEYLALSENAPVGVMKCDLEGNITYTNMKVIEILGSPSMEETKKINLLKFPLMIQYGLSKSLLECIRDKEPRTREMHYFSKWGKEVYLRTHSKPLEENGEVKEIQIILDDITEEKRLEETLRRLSVTDELTGVFNRRYMKNRIDEEIDKAKQDGHEFSLIMFDLDHFKQINDQYGHNVGDNILEMFSAEINTVIDQKGILSRWGGEEFLILLPGKSVQQTSILAEELRKRLSQINIIENRSVTASFGVTGYQKGDSISTLVKRVDDMLYQSKQGGRNCVHSSVTCI